MTTLHKFFSKWNRVVEDQKKIFAFKILRCDYDHRDKNFEWCWDCQLGDCSDLEHGDNDSECCEPRCKFFDTDQFY